MGIIEDINEFVDGYNYDESLSSLLKDVMGQQLTENPKPKNYYYVTDLTNPSQAFFSRLRPDIKKPEKLARKLALGKQRQSFASIWFRTLPDFIVEEGTIDGVWVGIPGVRGKIDYRVGDSILEFKTKDSIPETEEEIFSSYPQDLEQLAFYSVIHPSGPRVNYLVFMNIYPPFNIRAFKVVTKDVGRIKSIIKTRINILNKSFEDKDVSKLGRCRYYDRGCEFHGSGSCSCKQIEPIKIDALQKSVEVNFDMDFTKRLENARDECEISDPSSFSTKYIIAPRKHFMEFISGLESQYKEEKDEYKACIRASLNKMKKNHKIGLNGFERKRVMDSQLEPRVRVGFRWLKYKSSVTPSGIIVPYLLYVNPTTEYATRYPSFYHRAELGIICAIYGKNKGLIIKVYPNLNKLVQVFQVTYKNINGILKIVKETIDNLERGERENNLLSIPACPDFMNDNGKCPLMKDCHSVKGCGCVN